MNYLLCFAALCAEILWTKPICVETNRYIGWPTVCARANGELIAVFSGDRDTHVCPFGKVQLVRSLDGGETWSAPEIVRNSSLDDRDAGVLELRDGTLLVNTFSSTCFATERREVYRRIFAKIPDSDVRRDLGYWSLRSTDGGKTWEDPVRMRGFAPHGGIQLADGRLMQVGRLWNAQGNMHKDDPENRGKFHELPVEISSDAGRSWRVLSKIVPQEPYSLSEMHEPHLVELKNGTLLVQIRYHGRPRRTVQCESNDGGRTWSPIHETGIIGYPSHLLKLRDGRLLSTYARRDKDNWGEYAVVSSDDGRTWKDEDTVLLSRHFDDDLGYPSTIQLADGTLLTVCYQPMKKGEKPCLLGIKWKIEENDAK